MDFLWLFVISFVAGCIALVLLLVSMLAHLIYGNSPSRFLKAFYFSAFFMFTMASWAFANGYGTLGYVSGGVGICLLLNYLAKLAKYDEALNQALESADPQSEEQVLLTET